MTLREILKKIIDENLIDYVVENTINKVARNSDKNIDYSKAKNKISTQIHSLVSLEPQKQEFDFLACLKRMDFDYDDDYINVKYYDYYEAFGVYNNEDDHYIMDTVDWKKVMDTPILQTSLDAYGEILCVSTILYSLSWFGYDYDNATANAETFLKDLYEGIEEGKQEECKKEYIDTESFFNELREEVGLPRETEEEKKYREHQLSIAYEHVRNDYKTEYKKIFGKDFK